ncbi:transcriptional regulator [Calothrix sp. FACHB-1219]|uniref:helix-turn-helix domain-containing protein n=1 Tax=unclassified Calothrix TaxID=2619626 RepID=UPI001684C024|nr:MULTISPECIES: transcriptional regulator [unclassified Calothrix]MBD2205202.1 transcriptional regulator [Calothrix sp. FACHB-168]MBD2216608.1 transcriptional regulator [Calothrix sp. FACHB-1219]
MTLTFNSDKYKNLLVQYQPKLIRNEEENEKALAIVEELMHRSNLSPEEDKLYDLLIILIEKFDQEYYSPGKASQPDSILRFLMEQRDIKESDLVDIIGSQAVVSAVINGEQEISKAQAKALGEFFRVDCGLFI